MVKNNDENMFFKYIFTFILVYVILWGSISSAFAYYEYKQKTDFEKCYDFCQPKIYGGDLSDTQKEVMKWCTNQCIKSKHTS